eukprot:2724046-Rhodomonas_salina.1
MQPIVQPNGDLDTIVDDVMACCELCSSRRQPQKCLSFSVHKRPARLLCTLFAVSDPREDALARPFSTTGWLGKR